MRILHIVRDYGPVGGMERIVWELTRALARRGHEVEVLCEESHTQDLPVNGRCHRLGRILRKPRWLSHLIFSRRVTNWIRHASLNGAIIHSHERCSVHQVTTFHGPPFAPVRERPMWKRQSPRVAVNLWLERREVSNSSVRFVVPLSQLTGDLLRTYYPKAAAKVTEAIEPGVTPGPERPPRPVPVRGGVVGFVGYEWRRKGLDIAVQIAIRLSERRPDLQFWVAGPPPERIQHLFRSCHIKYRLLGNVKTSDLYPQLDLLLHPARQEPYGMVVVEAMAARLPVVISEDCGAKSEVTDLHGRVLSRERPLDEWAAACEAMLGSDVPAPGYARSWQQVAAEYEKLYGMLAGRDASVA